MQCEMFIRKAEGIGTWMVCGYADGSLGLGFHDFLMKHGSSSDTAHLWPIDMPEGLREVREHNMKGTHNYNHADLVTKSLWGRQVSPHLPVLQLHARAIAREPRFVMITGILQDKGEVLTKGWDIAGGKFICSGDPKNLLFTLDPDAPDLSFTAGHTLSQVQTSPIWKLGEPDLWGARFTMAPEISEACLVADGLREKIVSGNATPEDEAEFFRLQKLSGDAIQMKDRRFISFLQEMINLRGLTGEQHPLRTASEHEKSKRLSKLAIQKVLKREEEETPSI